jgi:sugar phosphate isomerase/epimerase
MELVMKHSALFYLTLFFLFCPSGESQSASSPDEIRIRAFPLAVQCWTYHAFSFYETLEKVRELGIQYIEPYPGQVLDRKNPSVKFDHNLTAEQISQVKDKLMETGVVPVSYGVVALDSSEVSLRKVFDFARTMGLGTIVGDPSFDDFTILDRLAREYGISVAIHNHPSPSKYALPRTVFDAVKGHDERIGACADTGHWMRSGANPVEALRLLEGRVVSVHLKDLTAFGDPKAEDVPLGQGRGEVKTVLAELTRQNYHGYLIFEHENPADVKNPSTALQKGIDYLRGITYFQGYEELLSWDDGRCSLHGWNHYGPGYFDLDEKNGVLSTHGGMGLLWYSVRKYRDFILELDWRCPDKKANSGIFLRVPEMPSSNEYTYHSLEVQILDSGTGDTKTGAIFDAMPPRLDIFHEAGQWNHYKITCKGTRITVELNNRLVIDWNAEPRGKIRDLSEEGYIGLQNHDAGSSVFFRNIFVKETVTK